MSVGGKNVKSARHREAVTAEEVVDAVATAPAEVARGRRGCVPGSGVWNGSKKKPPVGGKGVKGEVKLVVVVLGGGHQSPKVGVKRRDLVLPHLRASPCQAPSERRVLVFVMVVSVHETR